MNVILRSVGAGPCEVGLKGRRACACGRVCACACACSSACASACTSACENRT